VVGGFGLGAFLYAHLLRSLPAFSGGATSREAILAAFTASGVAFAILGGAGALLVRDPPAASPSGAVAPAGADLTPGAMVRTPQFWAAFAMLFLNVTAGILFISNAVPIMRELTGALPATAAAVYGTIALANALGRFLWGAVSDRFGRRAAFASLYLLQIAVFLSVGRFHSLWVVALLFALVLLCYGGGFGVMPSLVADWFGTRHLGVNYGWVLLAWSAAGLAGPGFVAAVKDRTGSYAGALPATAALLLVATLLPLLVRAPAGTRNPG
jgi:MFS family permease